MPAVTGPKLRRVPRQPARPRISRSRTILGHSERRSSTIMEQGGCNAGRYDVSGASELSGPNGAGEAGRPRRSCLTVPGSSERFLAKAAGLAADEVILDLEDSVAPGAKDGARELVASAVAGGDWTGRVLAVR